MSKFKNMRRIFCLSMAIMMAAPISAMADITIPPIPIGGQVQQDSGMNQIPGTDQNLSQGPAVGSGTVTQNGSTSPSRPPAVTAMVTTTTAADTTVQAGAGDSGAALGTAVKPVVQAQGAVLYDATHDQFLFEQNADTRYFPASITKLMTALLVLEHSNLNDTVTFSSGAVTNLESGAVTLKVKAGDKISVKDCLYGLLLKSANEVANGLAEHVSGSVSAFADLMNQKAASLGCTNTNFANPNGLNNPNHYTTPRDMARIAKAAFANPTLSQISSTVNYNFPATASVPTVRSLTMGHKMLNPANTDYYYQGIVGGKTGYTSLAGNTLVTCAERDGVRLVAVVLKSKQSHYQDTKALLDYGFAAVKAEAANTPQGTGPNAGNTGGPASGSMGSPSFGGQVQNGNTWVQDASGWRFMKADGSYAKNETMIINSEYYSFKDDQYMVTGWYQIDGIWYFFRPSGSLAVNRWIETNGMSYYVDATGSLFTGGTTPDGYKVDANGVWIP